MSEITTPRSRGLWRFVAVVLIAAGVFGSGYLLSRHFTLLGGDSELLDVCKAVFGGDCDTALRSDLAVQGGIPLAGWGLVQFATVAVSLLLAAGLGDTFKLEGTVAALVMCAAASGLGLVLTGMMLAGTATICPLCIFLHVLNLALIPTIVLASGFSTRELGSSLSSSARYLLGADVGDPILSRWKIAGLTLLALFGVVGYQWVLIQTDRHAVDRSSPSVDIEQLLAEFEAGQELDLSLSDRDPCLGDLSAELQLVVFSDFQCPACRRFAHTVLHLRAHLPELAIVFKHYPLSNVCNSSVDSDAHPLSCDAAHAAEAAHRQGKFWEYHDALFNATEALDSQLLVKIAESVGFDMSQFHAEFSDADTRAKVAADISLGDQLQVDGTPTAFLNNKRVPAAGMSVIDRLIERVAGHDHDSGHDHP